MNVGGESRLPCQSVSMEELDPFAQAVTRLSDEGLSLEITGRTFRLVDPVRGDAGAAALRLLAMVQAAAPVAIATHSSQQVAAAVWAQPRLYVVRWARNRWVVGYRLTSGSRPNDYVRTEGRIPGHLETGHWYESVPDEVSAVFADVGLALDTPPFPVPAQPEPEPPPRPRRTAAGAGGRVSAAEKAPPARPAPRKVSTPKPPPAPKPPPPPTSRLCPGCNMRRTLTQFEPGSEPLRRLPRLVAQRSPANSRSQPGRRVGRPRWSTTPWTVTAEALVTPAQSTR